MIGYSAKIASTRLNAFAAAASGVTPPIMISAQAVCQTCSFWTQGLRMNYAGEDLLIYRLSHAAIKRRPLRLAFEI